MTRRSLHEASPYSLLHLASPSPLMSAAAVPTLPPPSPFFAPFPPAAAALYQAGLLVNMYAAAAAAFTAASGAPCPEMLSPPPPTTPSSMAPQSGLDMEHSANRNDHSLISHGRQLGLSCKIFLNDTKRIEPWHCDTDTCTQTLIHSFVSIYAISAVVIENTFCFYWYTLRDFWQWTHVHVKWWNVNNVIRAYFCVFLFLIISIFFVLYKAASSDEHCHPVWCCTDIMFNVA